MAKTPEENKAAEVEAAAKAAAEVEAAAKALAEEEPQRAQGFYVCHGRGLTPPNGDHLRAGDLVPHQLYEPDTLQALVANGSIEWQD